MKRIICLFLAVALLVPTFSIFAAAEEAVPYSSSYFSSWNTWISVGDTTRFEIWIDVSATDTMDELGASAITLQKSADGENWSTMITYEPDYFPQLICEDTISHMACVSYGGTRGYYYRACVEYYAKNSSGRGYTYKWTQTVQL